MFKLIAYDLVDDTLIATNNKKDIYIYGNIPQRCEYFSSLGEAIVWIEKHPNAHKEYLKDNEEYYNYIYGDEINKEITQYPIDEDYEVAREKFYQELYDYIRN